MKRAYMLQVIHHHVPEIEQYEVLLVGEDENAGAKLSRIFKTDGFIANIQVTEIAWTENGIKIDEVSPDVVAQRIYPGEHVIALRYHHRHLPHVAYVPKNSRDAFEWYMRADEGIITVNGEEVQFRVADDAEEFFETLMAEE